MTKPWEEAAFIRNWVDSPAGISILNSLKLIWFGLISGATTFCLICLGIAPFLIKDEEPTWVLVALGIVFSISTGLVAQFFWMHMSNKEKEGRAPEFVANQVTSQWIVVLALHEGPLFLCLILFIVNQSNLEKGILLGLAISLLGLMALRFPTRSKLLSAMGGSD